MKQYRDDLSKSTKYKKYELLSQVISREKAVSKYIWGLAG
jgi:hypothetical protein